MKKIWDFEVITLLTIIILVGTVFFSFYYSTNSGNIVMQDNFNILNYEINITVQENDVSGVNEILKLKIINLENEVLFISNSNFEVLELIVGVIFAITNLIAAMIFAIIHFIKIITMRINKKILTINNDLLNKDNIDLPVYDVAIANTLYTGRIEFYKIYNLYRKYFEEKYMIDRDGNILENVDINNLNEQEQFFIPLYSMESIDKHEKIFKQRIIQYFENNEFLKKDSFRRLIDKYTKKIEDIIKLYMSKERYNVENIMSEILMAIVVFSLIGFLQYWCVIPVAIIVYIQLKYYNVFLSHKGKVERAKIMFLVNDLKTKEDLSEKEKFFLKVLTTNQIRSEL